MKPYGNIASKFENEMSQPARYEKTYESEEKSCLEGGTIKS